MNYLFFIPYFFFGFASSVFWFNLNKNDLEDDATIGVGVFIFLFFPAAWLFCVIFFFGVYFPMKIVKRNDKKNKELVKKNEKIVSDNDKYFDDNCPYKL